MNKSLYTILGILALSGIKAQKKAQNYKTTVRKTTVYLNAVDFGIIWKNDGFQPPKVNYFLEPKNLSSLESQLFEYLVVIIQDLVKVKLEVITYIDDEDNVNKRALTVAMWSLNNVPVDKYPELENSISAFIERYDCGIDTSNLDYYENDPNYDAPVLDFEEQSETIFGKNKEMKIV